MARMLALQAAYSTRAASSSSRPRWRKGDVFSDPRTVWDLDIAHRVQVRPREGFPETDPAAFHLIKGF